MWALNCRGYRFGLRCCHKTVKNLSFDGLNKQLYSFVSNRNVSFVKKENPQWRIKENNKSPEIKDN